MQGSWQDSENPCLELSSLADTEHTNGKHVSFMLPAAISLSQVQSQLYVFGRILIREGKKYFLEL